MGAGGLIGRGVMAAAPKMAGYATAGIGEGVMSAGSTAEQIRQGTKDGLMTGGQGTIEDNYLSQDGTEQELYSLIQRAVAGEKIAPLYAEGVAEGTGPDRRPL